MTVRINNKHWVVAKEETIEDYAGTRANLLARCKKSGIEAVVTVKRPNGDKCYQAFRYADGSLRWAQ